MKIDWKQADQFEQGNAEEICRHFFPHGKKVGNEWKLGDVSGSAGQSLGIQLSGERAGLWTDRATGEGGKLRNLIARSRGIQDEYAVEEIERAFGISFRSNGRPDHRNSKRRFDWNTMVAAATDADLRQLSDWRGLSVSTCIWLREQKLIGRQNGSWAFPIHSAAGGVIGAHVRRADGGWFYMPKGTKLVPLIFGDLASALQVFIAESQWDLIAVLDRIGITKGENIAGIATRGAANGKLVGALQTEAEVVALPQNDEPGLKWLENAKASVRRSLRVLRTPAGFKDLNDWLKAEPDADLCSAIANAEFEENAAGNSTDIAPDLRPKVRLAGPGRPESEFAAEVGEALHDLAVVFLYNGRVVEVEDEQFDGEFDRFKLARGGLKFVALAPTRAKTSLEEYIETGHEAKADSDRLEFVAKTMSKSQSESLLAAPQFLKRLPQVDRILDVAIPVCTRRGDIIFPNPGFNKQLGVYVSPASPGLTKMPLEEALRVLEEAHTGFCWKNAQAKIHAVARILTPFARGLMGFQERPPLWFFWGNRPRCGKDYLNGITQITYLGHAFEDVAITRNSDETTKRIVAALRAGRRMMHFANCQRHLDDLALIQAVTAPTFNSRSLGSNDANADLELSNEIEFSISANAGLTYREDVEPRLRKIELSFDDEDSNGRVFPRPHLHAWVKDNRQLLLSAIYSIIQYWVVNGAPLGKTRFNSFPRWAEVVGGIMQSASLGDPCLPHEGEELFGGDSKERAMKALYAACFEEHPDEWITKSAIYNVISSKSESFPALEWFGDFTSEKPHAVRRTGNALSAYQNRIFKDVRLVIDASLQNSQKWRYKFVPV